MPKVFVYYYYKVIDSWLKLLKKYAAPFFFRTDDAAYLFN